jgi:hypothetical protein
MDEKRSSARRTAADRRSVERRSVTYQPLVLMAAADDGRETERRTVLRRLEHRRRVLNRRSPT